jgi:4-amino-4-deoxy-L-arabinose transferase-like glycosyltransferase
MKIKGKPKPIRKRPHVQRGKIVSEKKGKSDYYIVALLIIILLISLIRWRLTNIPLERDEGEYAYLGKLITQGEAPYKEAYNMKLPGTYLMYGIIMSVFGQSVKGIHVGLLLMNALTMLFFFTGFRKLFSPAIGLFSASVYGIMSLSQTTLGFAAHATHFVCFFVSMGIIFLARLHKSAKEMNSLIIGLMFGLAFLMKQQAVFFLVFGGIAVILHRITELPRSYKKIISTGGLYSAGAVFPYIITVILLKLSDAFDKFWFWTVEYASRYASGVSFKNGKDLFAYSFKPMWQEFPIFWVLFFVGIVLTVISDLTSRQKIIALSFSLLAFLTICPGFYFRQHYFISFLPAVGLLGGISLHVIATNISRYLKLKVTSALTCLIIIIAFAVSISGNKDYYLRAEPEVIARAVYGSNPFPESKVIADYIQVNSSPDDKIAVLGSEPQIFFYANRRSATGYIYTYGLMEIHEYNIEMQEEMIAEIEKNKPRFLVFCNIPTSWLSRPASPRLIFDWFNKYIQLGFELSGVADIISQDLTVYKWGEDARKYQRKGKDYILIFKKIH